MPLLMLFFMIVVKEEKINRCLYTTERDIVGVTRFNIVTSKYFTSFLCSNFNAQSPSRKFRKNDKDYRVCSYTIKIQ